MNWTQKKISQILLLTYELEKEVLSARNVEGVKYANTVVYAVSARIVKG